jgi:hypothetical protein
VGRGDLTRRLLFGLALAGAGAVSAQQPLRVGEVRIQCLDVFTQEEEARGWLYRAADAIHMETQTRVVRRFLLFHEGDLYDPALLAQSERNLRALSLFKSVRVQAGTPHDGIVDVDVVTQDAWTTEFEAHLGRGGGETTWSAGITESNVLGLGKEIGFLYDADVERTNRFLEFHDPALLGPYWSAGFLWADSSDGDQRRFQIGKAFTSTLDPYAAAALFDRHLLQERIYADGVVASEYARKRQQIRLALADALLPGPLSAGRLTAGLDFFRDTFTALPDRPGEVLPENRDLRYVFVGWESVSTDFVSESYVNRGERVEDFNLGMRLAAEVGVSPKAFGVDQTSWAVAGEASRGWRLGPGAFVRAAVSYRTRLSSMSAQNSILSGTLLFVWKHPTTFLQTTVAQVQIDRGWNLDRDVQFFADGDHGLRGYRLYAFEGDRRIVVNLEHRVFGGVEILQLFSLGAAVFVDTGTAVPPGEPLNFASLKTDAGAGLRIGIARAAFNSVLRLDAAYAFNSDPLGRHGWLVSFSSGQAF